ncbi:MAG: PBP1A family penicillin-binding protein, partial [Desulfosudaceae bacterium]
MIKKIIKGVLLLLVLLVLTVGITGSFFYYRASRDLPKLFSLKEYRPPVITSLYGDDGRKLAEFYNQRRIVIPLEEMPDRLINAFVAAEDARFFQHTGIDVLGILRAFLKNMEAGSIVQGGSTITQQVAKSFFLSPERTYTRKIKEAILSNRIEKRFSKEDILFLYLNQIYLGHGAYGVEAAAENYFDKTAAELNLAECALLAGLPQAPSRYSPFRHPERARSRQLYVLNQMVARGSITPQEAEAARQALVEIKPDRNWFQEQTPWYSEYVRRYLVNRYGEETVYNEGLTVRTAVLPDMQKTARKEIEKGLRALDKRQGFRGPEQHLAAEDMEPFLADLKEAAGKTEKPLSRGDLLKGLVVAVDDDEGVVLVRTARGSGEISLADMRWARRPDEDIPWYRPAARIDRPSRALSVGDVIQVGVKEVLAEPADQAAVDAASTGTAADETRFSFVLEQEPAVESVLLCLETGSGLVRAMVGGRSFKKSQFNRAVQAKRQPGSAFKPIIYAAALDKGYTPASMIVDSAIVFEDKEHDFTWKPRNYEQKFYGPTLFSHALIKSHNIPTIKILMDIGVDYVRDYAAKMGIESTLNRDLSIALGSSVMAPLELVTAYSVFANLGDKIPPVFIKSVQDRDGNVLERHEAEPEQVIDPDTAYIMTHLLKGVVERGTGRRVRALQRPAAGKTGTTDNLDDAWFVGYTPGYVTAVWVGFDSERSLGASETGASAAIPIWLGFMKRILADQPVKYFEVPAGVVFSKIDAETGLLPSDESENILYQCFKEGCPGLSPRRHCCHASRRSSRSGGQSVRRPWPWLR